VIKQLNPPVSIDNVEVIGFDSDTLSLHAVFNIYVGEPHPDVQTKMKTSIRNALRYMEVEGFIPPKMTWNINAGVVLHPPKK
jgi:hypothetical protein